MGLKCAFGRGMRKVKRVEVPGLGDACARKEKWQGIGSGAPSVSASDCQSIDNLLVTVAHKDQRIIAIARKVSELRSV